MMKIKFSSISFDLITRRVPLPRKKILIVGKIRTINFQFILIAWPYLKEIRFLKTGLEPMIILFDMK